MRQTTSDIFKKIAPSILIYLVLVAAFSVITEMMGLGSDAFFKVTQPGEVAAPKFDVSGMSFFAGILQLAFYLAMALVGFGIVLSIYRIARYGTDISFADQFFFFGKYSLKAILTYIVQNILVIVGLIVLIVPGILISLALTPLGAVMGINYLRGETGVFQGIKDSWAVTKGFKGMIFGRMLIAVFAIFAIVFIGIFASFATGMGGNAVFPMIQNVLFTIICGVIMYVAIIDIIRELVERGAFNRIEGPSHSEPLLEEGE